MDIKVDEIKKILIIKPRGIGDIILSTIILENLRNHFHNSKIDYLVESFAKEVLENNPLINKILTFEKSDFILKTILKIRKEKYDLIIDLWSNPRTAQITFFSGAKFRVGYAYRGRKFAYNIKSQAGRGNTHSAEHNLELLRVAGIPIVSKKIIYNLTNESIEFAKSFIKEIEKKETLIGVIPSGGWNSKRCPKEKWVEIIKSLSGKINCNILILWGQDDFEDANFIKNNITNSILAPETNLKQMAGLLSLCNLVIANDSGPMHFSAALGIPTLGLFGPTDPKKHGPYSDNSDFVIKNDLHCIICNKLECPFNKECFYELDIDTIIEKSKKLLDNNVEKN